MIRRDRPTRWLILAAMVTAGLVALTTKSLGNPNFSRKYRLDCSTCHTVPPQLTRAGIEFRRLGYRFPNELNQQKTQPIPAHGEAQDVQARTAMTTMNAAGCASCHAVEPGQAGMSLQKTGARMSAEQIRLFVTSDQHPGADAARAMPSNDLEAVAAYLATLKEGPEEDQWAYNFAHYLSTRGRTRYYVQSVTNQDTRNEFRFNDMTFYYLGPLNPYLTIFFETEFEEGFDPNVLAQGTFIYGNPDEYGYIKLGNMRLVRQGVGMLDRPKTISTDLAASGKSHLFALNTDQRGVELGYGFNGNRTVIRGFLMNGIDSTGNGRPIGRQDLNSQKDLALVVENLFGEKTASAFSALAYFGHTPTSGGNISFYRLGLFGALAFNNKQNFEDIRLSGGILYGSDDVPTKDPGDKNVGFAVGLDKRLGDQFYLSTRYDQFRPTDRVENNTTKSYTAGLMKQILTYLRLTAEYQLLQRPGDINDNRFTAEFYAFF